MRISNVFHFIGALFMILLFPLNMFATPISKGELISLGQKAFYQKALGISPESTDSPLKDFFFIEENDETMMAVLNFSDGYLVISAEDAVMPVLAYGFKTNLEENSMAPGARMWLELYTNEIREIRRLGITASQEVEKAWSEIRENSPKALTEIVVSPLLLSHWNQNKYYNRYSPIDTASPSSYDSRTPNGCVAVAMSQILYYYRYPSHGYGSHTNHSGYGNFSVNFGQQNYDYDAMTNQLSWYNDEVAKLIFHCATSVDMVYGPDGSGAYSEDVPNAITSYFGYSSDVEYRYKNSTNSSQWRNYLKADLNASRPVYYSGHGSDGGHAFVCDGYNSDNYFHFNFGWGGSSDGYFALSSSGGATNPVGGFSNGQAAAFNIHPADDNYPYFCNSKVMQCSNGTFEDGSSNEDYQNNTSCSFVITETDVRSIDITFSYFDTQLDHDSLSFWDGNPSNGHLLRTFSGHLNAGAYYSFQTDSLYVTFNTDDSITDKGWLFEYYVNRITQGCGSSQIHDGSGIITDGSGDNPYRSNSNCTWLMRIFDATYITFIFESFDLSPEDEIAFYDIRTTPRTLIATYSGDAAPDSLRVNTSKVMVKFMSDNYKNRDGFVIRWTSDAPINTDAIQNFDNQMEIFPNPAVNLVTVMLPNVDDNSVISIYDVAGRQVMSDRNVHIYNGKCDVDVSNLTSGVYFFVYKNSRNIYKRKLIIER
ncbi:MAG: C10 family peptidase [Bacteroidales bacterium]|nr:C10 family peptidase [Bacteroidales bacterium]